MESVSPATARLARGAWFVLVAVSGGCPADDPVATDLATPADTAPVDLAADGGDSDAAAACAVSWSLAEAQVGACDPLDSDYAPGADDGWPTCISDDGAYHRFEPSISSIARVAAFERITELLLVGAPLSPQAFVDARLAYTEPEGLDSRVSRREDEHYPAAETACADMTTEQIEAHAERCVGQARIQPLLTQAFQDGIQGDSPLLSAARIEAGLLWFLYVSTHKEANSCTDKKKDCDSSYAYYGGGEPADAGLGLARYVRAASPATDDDVWNGLLAVRCWRDLDDGDPPANLELRDRAIEQLDRALLRGLAAIVSSRIEAYETQREACHAARAPLWETIRILGGVLDRAATELDTDRAAVLREELAKEGEQADRQAVAVALAELFLCR